MARKHFISILLLFLLGEPLFAHKPIWNDNLAADANSAIPLIDPNISQVVYRSLPAGPNQIWTTQTAHKDFNLYVQIGVPVIERLKNFRPFLAVIAQGLSADPNLPFKIPDGFGAAVVDTNSVEPRFFHEPFTGTDSWILTSKEIKLPESGSFYVVAFDPKTTGGKLWISVGRQEKFGLSDILNIGKTIRLVRSFHEVDGQSDTDPNQIDNKN